MSENDEQPIAPIGVETAVLPIRVVEKRGWIYKHMDDMGIRLQIEADTYHLYKHLVTQNLDAVTTTIGGTSASKTIKVPVIPAWLRKRYAEHIRWVNVTVDVHTPVEEHTLQRYEGYPKIAVKSEAYINVFHTVKDLFPEYSRVRATPCKGTPEWDDYSVLNPEAEGEANANQVQEKVSE